MTARQTRHLKSAFLESFRVLGNVSAACRAAGVPNRTEIYRWQEHDPAFAAEYRQAEIEATETLEGEARRRAVEGVRRLKFDKDGEAVKDPETGEPYTELQYSDTLLIFLLKARAPEKYRERQSVEHSGPGGGPIQTEHGGGIEVRAVDYRITAAALKPED